jgi:hypothetical protein
MENLPEISDEPLEYGWSPKTQFTFPQEMVNIIAQGLEEPADVAARFSISPQTWEKLSTWKPFLDAVAAQKAELEKSGFVFQTKVRWMASDLTEDLYIKARHPDATIGQKLETAKYLAKIAGLEPKEAAGAGAGEGFSVSININGTNTTISGGASRTADAETVETSPQGGYYIAPLIDPGLFMEMAENAEDGE